MEGVLLQFPRRQLVARVDIPAFEKPMSGAPNYVRVFRERFQIGVFDASGASVLPCRELAASAPPRSSTVS